MSCDLNVVPAHPGKSAGAAANRLKSNERRTLVRQLLVAAEAAGLVKLHARGGRRVEILPRLWSSHDRGMSAGMYGHDMIYLATQRAAQSAGRAA